MVSRYLFVRVLEAILLDGRHSLFQWPELLSRLPENPTGVVALRSKWAAGKAVRAGLGPMKEHLWPIRRAVASSGHSTGFHTRPKSRLLAYSPRKGLPSDQR
jgi:hypothetical protein